MNNNKPLNYNAQADELLVIRCQIGERDAYEQLILRWHKPLWRYARNLAGSDTAADDATQDIWLGVLRGIVRLRDGAKLRSWLFGIAHRVLIDRLRKQYTRPASFSVDVEKQAATDSAVELEFELTDMLDELARMPLVENEVLTLFYLKELSLDDVAQVLGIPAGTVKSRLHRARNILRHQLNIKGDN